MEFFKKMKTKNTRSPQLDAYLKFLWSVSEKDLKSASRIRNDIRMNRWINNGTKEGERWRAFDKITSRNRRFKKLQVIKWSKYYE